MYCVIQKIQNKRLDPNAAYKEILSDEQEVFFDFKQRTKYGYLYSYERFERPIRDVYKISIHESRRENGHVKKRQWSICTLGYYDLATSRFKDLIDPQIFHSRLLELGITERQLLEMIHQKLDPIIDVIKAEFEATEEYRAIEYQKKQLKAWRLRKTVFKKSHGVDAYEYCFDFFNNPKNYEYEWNLRDAYDRKKRQEAREREAQEEEKRKQSNYNSNYSYTPPSYSLQKYTDAEKTMLKKFYRHLAKSFHPDIIQDDGEMMKLIIKLKEEWGI